MSRTMDAQRERLPSLIRSDFRQAANVTGVAQPSDAVMKALQEVPRHLFVQKAFQESAYSNSPLPIGQGQTISQPFIVALMTELLQLKPTDKVLEIGTGCGYQSAVLSLLAKDVYSLEIIPELQKTAAERLTGLGYDNVHVRLGDGRAGWQEEAPFDAILVAATADNPPQSLLDQLAPGGRLVIPVRDDAGREMLQLVTKDATGQQQVLETIAVRFVPLTGSD
ncbi:MAG TPA: protein-L-isoaspartate(D-aspartate) O-methyltransferase [Dongiaceae bacterium]|nr:protein-L-isoaspartate(D-aspartate) O-methyltransferase [Dongiaceae bacterium]